MHSVHKISQFAIIVICLLVPLLFSGCAAKPMIEPESSQQPAAESQAAPADETRERKLEEGGIGGTGNQCNEGKTPESPCQEPRP